MGNTEEKIKKGIEYYEGVVHSLNNQLEELVIDYDPEQADGLLNDDATVEILGITKRIRNRQLIIEQLINLLKK
tara:strand:+ start:292 stop:513 length:222 start_codon:yes stop_codon:yes gene_type:complete